MTFEYYPDDIATALINAANFPAPYPPEATKDIEEAICHLKAICENEYNADYFRKLYRLLESIADAHLYE